MSIAVITTFGNAHWNIYAQKMVQSLTQYWPAEIPLLIELDNEALIHEVGKYVRPSDAMVCGWTDDHTKFVQEHGANDDPSDYRRQTTRFCHKVFALRRALDAVRKQKAAGGDAPRYLIWLDADVITNRTVSMAEILECLPKEGEAVAYLGRKDWPHSECGWLAFDLENRGDEVIDVWHGLYVSGEILKLKETHDSWAFDHIINSDGAPPCTNLTSDKPGMDIWPHSPMGKWSMHFKGPVAKQALEAPPGKVVIQTKNSVPDDKIQSHIAENQKLIRHWVKQCLPTNEQIVVVSAGPQLMAEDVIDDYRAGKKIVAVKHALAPLKEAGILPWACILLDPRPHVYDFVTDPDPDVLWFVASQVDPRVTTKLLAHGCKVWGYHAAVGAGEHILTAQQPHSVISGGSATATRGLFLLKHLGFNRIKLYGYDLCLPDKPDLNARDDHGQPKFLEISIGWNNPLSNLKKCFWSEPQLIAQFEEMNHLIQNNIFDLEAVGDGIIPFILKGKRGGELRAKRLQAKMEKPLSYRKLLKCQTTKGNFNKALKARMTRIKSLTTPRSILPRIRRRTIKATK